VILPSLADALIVIVLLIPGFIAFALMRRIAEMGQRFTDFETTIWSIFLSLVIYVPFSLYTGLTNFDAIRDQIFLPQSFVSLIASTLGVGVVLGVSRRHFRKGVYVGTTWDLVVQRIKQKGGGFVIVYTQNGSEYKGKLHYVGVGEKDGSSSLIVESPKLIRRDKEWVIIEEVEMGKEMLFTDKDVSRVLFFDSI
jgi:hypothetical protein